MSKHWLALRPWQYISDRIPFNLITVNIHFMNDLVMRKKLRLIVWPRVHLLEFSILEGIACNLFKDVAAVD